MTAPPIFVGVAQSAVATGDTVLATVGLGSCVAILLHDAVAGVAGLAHVLLPEPHAEPDPAAPAKYATTAVPHLVREMEARGALRARLTARLVGGAAMFSGARTSTLAGAGARNVAAVRAALAQEGIPVTGEEVGRAHGRAVRLYAADGRVRVTSYRHPDVELQAPAEAGFAMKIMTFHLPDGDYAVDLSSVVEVVRPRGGHGPARAAARVDLADRLGLGRGTGEDAPTVVLRGAGGEAGMRVERLGEVVEVAEEQIRGLPRYFAHPLMRGVAEVDDRLVVLLDAEGLVAGAAEREGQEG